MLDLCVFENNFLKHLTSFSTLKLGKNQINSLIAYKFCLVKCLLGSIDIFWCF